MKRFLFFWVVILVLALSGCGETNASTDASGNVDSQQGTAPETDVAEAEAAEQTAEQSAEGDTEETVDSETVLVNLVTKLAEKHIIANTGTALDGYEYENTRTYTYDNFGNTTSLVYVDQFSGSTTTYYYTYDEAGNQIGLDYTYETETSSGTGGTETKSEYDTAGKLVSEEVINFSSDSDGEETTPYGVFDYSYDGNVGTATATVQSDGETFTETRTVTYNGEGVLLSEAIYYDNGYSSKTTYDETGRTVSVITTYSDGLTRTLTYDYTDDSQGNLLTRILKMESEYNKGEHEGETTFEMYRYFEYSYNEDDNLENISGYYKLNEDDPLTLFTSETYSYHYLDNGLLSSVDGYDEDGNREEELFYFEYEAAVQLPADEAEAVQEAQTDLIRSFLRN